MENKKNNRRSSVKTQRFNVKEADTLLSFLFKSLPEQSKTTTKSLLSHKQVAINGKYTTKFDAPVKNKDVVTIGPVNGKIEFSNPKLNILFEDRYLIVVDKAHGLLSVGTDKDKENTAYRILSNYVKQSHPANKIFILHRLDRETSGLMMFAKDVHTQSTLQHHWDNMILDRRYVAVVEGKLSRPEGKISSYIAENSAMVVHTTSAEHGKLAITNYKVLKTNSQYSLVELELETGRKNQIRVHMQEEGCPIIGDKKYGAKTNPINRLALHANKLKFVHPSTKKVMDFETPIPRRFLQIFMSTAK